MSYLKNLAESLTQRVAPAAGRQVFGNEFNKTDDFTSKLSSAKEIFDKAKGDVASTGEAFAGIGPVSKKLKSQLRTGRIGQTAEEADAAMMQSMGIGDLDNLEINFSDKDSTSSVTENNTEFHNTNNIFSVNGAVGNSLTKGDALLNERLTINGTMTASSLNTLISINTNIVAKLAELVNFQQTATTDFYEITTDSIKLSAGFAEKFDPMMDNIKGFFQEEANKREELAKQKALKKEGDGGINGVLDPEAMMKRLTGGNFEMMFGEMSPLRGMLQNASADPLGTLMAAGLGSAITHLFTKQVDFFKQSLGSIEYKIQGTLENWSNLVDDPANPSPLSMVKKKLGELLKVNRDTKLRLSTGGYTEEAVFDGQTRKAIVDVIPMYLSKILKAVSDGKDHEVYDYSSGRFKSGHALNRQNQKELARIDRGEFAGGLGNELKYGLMGNTDLLTHEKTRIRKEVFRKSLGNNSHNVKMEDLVLSTPELTKKFQDHYAKLSSREKNDFIKSFRASRFERSTELAKYQAKFGSTGMEAANILNNKDYGLRTEFRDPAITNPPPPPPGSSKKKKNPNGPPRPPTPNPSPAPNPGPNPDITRDRNGRPRPKLDIASDWLRIKLKAAKDAAKRNAIRAKLSASKVTKYLKDAAIKNIITPFKASLIGANRAEKFTLLESLKKSFTRNIVFPLKKALLGGDKSTREIMKTSFIKSLGTAVDRTILMPFKTFLVGSRKAKAMNILDSIKMSFSKNILLPFKKTLLGDGTTNKEAQKTTLVDSLKARLDKSIVFPLKQALLGQNTDSETVKNTSLLASIGKRFDASVMLPFKTMLLGGNARKAQKMSFFQSLGERFERSVLMPVKTVLLGGESRSKTEIFRTSFMKAISTGFNERILQPISGLLFGKENAKKGIFNNLGTMLSPFFNKMLFGFDKANKNGFIQNLKNGSKELWSAVWGSAKNKFFTPLANSMKELFGPVLKDFKETIGGELKHLTKNIFGSVSGGIKVGAKGLFKDVFGDETVKLLRDNIITPLKDLTSKLNDGISKVFKFLIRMPINLLKGVTDSVKVKRIKEGRGNYSEEEKSRLLDLAKNNKLFNFMNLGEKKDKGSVGASSTKLLGGVSGKVGENEGEEKKGFFNNLFGNRNRNSKAGTKIPSLGNSENSISNILNYINPEERKSINARLWRDSANNKLGQNSSVNSINSYINNTENNKTLTQNNKSSNTDTSIKSLNNTPRGENISSLPGSFSKSDIYSISHAASLISKELPRIAKGSSAASDLLAFAKQNLTKLDARLENIVKLLRKQNGSDVKGIKGSNLSIFRNPFQWIGSKFDKLTSFATKITGTLLGTVGKVTNSLLSIPGKIIGSVTSVVTTAANSLMKVGSSLLEGAGNAISGMIKFASKAIVGIGDGLGKIVSGLSSAVGSLIKGAGEFISNISGPLAKGIGNLVGAISTSLVPIISSAGKALGGLIEGARLVVTEFSKMAFTLAKGTAIFAGKALSRLTGMTMGFNKSHGEGGGSVFVNNIKEFFSTSKVSPMRVIVVDGKIGTYTAPTRRGTIFMDNEESRSLLGVKKSTTDKKDDKTGIIANALGSLKGIFGGGVGLLGKAVGGLSGVVSSLGAATLGLGKVMTKLLTSGGISDIDLPNGKRKRLGRRLGRNNGIARTASNALSDVAETTTTRSAKKGLLGRATNALAESSRNRVAESAASGAGKSFLGRYGTKLLKGAGIAGAVSLGGNLLADAVFEKGGAAHAMTSTGSTYAGYGAMVGSVVPVVGTAVGAVVGGVIGVLKEGLPRLLKWTETKFEKEIRNATEYLIEIPQRITAFAAELPARITEFAQTLPEKVSSFMNDLPGSIVKIFTPDSDGVTVDENGNVVEDRPSILGRLFVAMGQAIGSIVLALPKIAVSILEGLGKLVISAGTSAATLAAKGIYSVVAGLGDTVSKLFDTVAIKAKSMLPSMLGGMSDEEAAAAMKEVDKKYEKRALERSSTLVSMSDKGVDITKSLTSWSIADKMGDQGPSEITKNREAYNRAMADAGGDTDKAKALFANRLKALGKDSESAEKEFVLQQGEEKNRVDNIKSNIDADNKYQFNTGGISNVSYATNSKNDPKTFTADQVKDAIQKAADYSGIPFKTMEKIASIESGMRYWVTNKFGYQGLYQMGKDEFAKFSPNPTGSALDPYNNAMAAANYMMYHAKHMKAAGIPVTPENIYLAHQQGLGGIKTITAAAQAGMPEVNSVNIRRNMLNNPPQDGAGATSNPSQFLGRWGKVMNNGAAPNGTIGVMAPKQSPNAVNMATGNTNSPNTSVDPAQSMLNQYISGVKALDNVGNYKFGGQNNKKNFVTPVVNTSANTSAASQSTPVNVSTNINSNSQTSKTVQTIAEAKAAPIAKESNPIAEAITAEMSKQTSLLQAIAENTKEGVQANFFTNGSVDNGQPTQPPKSTIQQLSNQDAQALMLRSSQPPIVLKPGAGAINVAKVGNQ